MPLALDIHTFVQAALLITVLAIILQFWSGISSLRAASKIKFFRIRNDRTARGWRSLFIGVLLCGLAFYLYNYAEPVAYTYFPPSPSPTKTIPPSETPTITTTPTITLTPTITPTPAESYTPTPSNTPFIPPTIEASFQSSITPNPNAVFSVLIFAEKIDVNYRPLSPAVVFKNPLKGIYAVFTYDNMNPGAQWTALWLREGELVHIETKPWDGSTGGFGFTEWHPTDPSAWQPGEYQVQIFTGTTWKQSGTFRVEGEPPTLTATNIPTKTRTPSPTRTATPTRLTPTPWPSATRTVTRTPWPTATAAPTKTRPSPASPSPVTGIFSTPTPVLQPMSAQTHTRTPRPTITPTPTRPTSTPFPTVTLAPPTPRPTAWPTAPLVPSRTPRPTITPTLTRPTSTPYPTVTPAPPTPRPTAWPTAPLVPSRTPRPTITPTPTRPTSTPYPTVTRAPRTPTPTPWPTLTRTATAIPPSKFTPTRTPTAVR